MKRILKTIWTEDKAENIPEYALLLFLVTLTALSTMGGVATKVNKICFAASVHMTTASNSALMGATTGYAGQAPANPDSDPAKVSQQVKR
ncbi:MAG TPA: hypothetical protein VFQ24_17675 [Terriglobia bacterium]|nr:hypothetical protein [Terriglobia bacterium]